MCYVFVLYETFWSIISSIMRHCRDCIDLHLPRPYDYGDRVIEKYIIYLCTLYIYMKYFNTLIYDMYIIRLVWNFINTATTIVFPNNTNEILKIFLINIQKLSRISVISLFLTFVLFWAIQYPRSTSNSWHEFTRIYTRVIIMWLSLSFVWFSAY